MNPIGACIWSLPGESFEAHVNERGRSFHGPTPFTDPFHGPTPFRDERRFYTTTPSAMAGLFSLR